MHTIIGQAKLCPNICRSIVTAFPSTRARTHSEYTPPRLSEAGLDGYREHYGCLIELWTMAVQVHRPRRFPRLPSYAATTTTYRSHAVAA